ncbi:GNAT family N-acetyltransferase [Flavihumibacter profundi]|jgi:ribosomal protein S18 acetylase RimI-like enzyme|uniref:GNAT family N-acetyltransferase n=1 Tax=Flavihumibacter profundi TaxID=2716883 RepID=UPI001CC60D6C|nr:GNAT family N-acetyltransferase [Flavihumibacter profundi]MBZ5859047.1 GNAT family N-acetyltransferase [Flavihumibacter profundi]
MITIRKAFLSDLAAVAFLFDQYRQFYNQLPDLDKARAFLKERLEKNESVILVAMENGEFLGFTQLYPIFSSVSLSRTWLLNDLFVSPEQRGKGIGSMLLDAAKEIGRHSNAKWILLETAEDNTIAQSVYEKNGWIRETDRYYRFDLE